MFLEVVALLISLPIVMADENDHDNTERLYIVSRESVYQFCNCHLTSVLLGARNHICSIRYRLLFSSGTLRLAIRTTPSELSNS
jgi:hypothetical protein